MLAISALNSSWSSLRDATRSTPKSGRREPAAIITDDALLEAIATGDASAMAALYGRHSGCIYRFALRITGNPACAEDVVSDVFLDVWRQAGKFKARSRVSTWLLAIARNKSLTAIRRHLNARLDERDAETIEDPADAADDVVGRNERSTAIQKCLSQLSAAQREVIDLVYYHNKSVDEVARIVGMPASTVKTRMFYARRRLHKLLAAAGINSVH